MTKEGKQDMASESRQQRRARERSEVKAATRPGVRTLPKRELIIDVELHRGMHDDSYGIYVSWYAEWGVRDDSSGVEDSSEDLAELVEGILEDARRWADRYSVRLVWTLEGDEPDGKTIADAVAELGVTLPKVVV